MGTPEAGAFLSIGDARQERPFTPCGARRPRARGRGAPGGDGSATSVQRGDAHKPLRESGGRGANNGRQKGKGVGLVGSAGACGSPGVWSAGGALAALAVPCRTTFGHGAARVRRNGWRKNAPLVPALSLIFSSIFLFYGGCRCLLRQKTIGMALGSRRALAYACRRRRAAPGLNSEAVSDPRVGTRRLWNLGGSVY